MHAASNICIDIYFNLFVYLYILYLLTEVWSTTYYMGKYNGPTAKPHRLWSNDEGLLEVIHQQAGTLTQGRAQGFIGRTTGPDIQGQPRQEAICRNPGEAQAISAPWYCLLGICVLNCLEGLHAEFGAALAKIASVRKQAGPSIIRKRL